MSRTLWPLLKTNLKVSFEFKTKKQKYSTSTILILLGILGMVLSGFYSFVFAMAAAETNTSLDLVLYSMIGFTSLLALTTTIPKVKSTLFGGKDYDMLAALPIPKREILFVKFLSLYIIELFYTVIIVLPSGVVCTVLSGEMFYLLETLIVMFFVPMLPLLVGSIIGTIISVVADRYKIGNIISIILYIGLFSVFMFISMSGSMDTTNQSLDPMFNMLKFFNPTILLLEIDIPLINYFSFIGCNLIILAIVVVMLAKMYDYIHNLLSTSVVSDKKFEISEIKTRPVKKSLLKIEFKRYFASKGYLMNTLIGGVMCVIMSIVLPLSLLKIDEPEVVSVLKSIIPYFSIMIMWFVGMGVPACSAISIEGKNFWIIKTLPVDYKDVLKTKILLSEIVLAPCILISSIILTCFSNITIEGIICLFVLPQLYLLSINYLALNLNTKYYNLTWANELEVVKQSRCVLFTMLIDFLYSIILAAALILCGIFINMIVGIAICFVLEMTVIIIFRNRLYKNGPIRLSEIEV